MGTICHYEFIATLVDLGRPKVTTSPNIILVHRKILFCVSAKAAPSLQVTRAINSNTIGRFGTIDVVPTIVFQDERVGQHQLTRLRSYGILLLVIVGNRHTAKKESKQ
jgi:hypothetical protein